MSMECPLCSNRVSVDRRDIDDELGDEFVILFYYYVCDVCKCKFEEHIAYEMSSVELYIADNPHDYKEESE